MPELPEVETVRQDLERLTAGEQIAWVKVWLDRTVAAPAVERFCDHLVGCRFQSWLRRGKFLLARFEGGSILGVHLRMTGRLLWLPPEEPITSHTRIQLGMVSGAELRFDDQRTFGQMWSVPLGIPPEQVITGLQGLGPEPFSPEFSVNHLQDRLSRSLRPIKNALLDQRLVAGVGNIYADEALFLARIHPRRVSRDLRPPQILQLREQLIQVLHTSIQQRGTTFSTYRDASGVNGNYQGQAWVYGREGQPCRICETPIQRLKLAGRSAHFCPQCQSADPR